MVMKKFMDDNFMLNNETAAKLFNDYAKDMPIFDYDIQEDDTLD